MNPYENLPESAQQMHIDSRDRALGTGSAPAVDVESFLRHFLGEVVAEEPRDSGALRSWRLTECVVGCGARGPAYLEQLPDGRIEYFCEGCAPTWADIVGHCLRSRGPFALLSDCDLQHITPISWLIDGVLPTHAVTALVGESGIGKTFLLVDFVYSVAAGVPWLGHVVQQGPAVVIEAEGVNSLHGRAAAWKAAHGFDPSQPLPGIHFIPEAVQLAEPQEIDEVIALLAMLSPPPTLVVFDTLARCFVGRDENSASDMGLVIEAAERVRRDVGATVMLVHHSGKNGDGPRGSSALECGVDTMLVLKEREDGLELLCKKQRGGEEFSTFHLSRTPVVLLDGTSSCFISERTAGSNDDTVGGNAAKALAVLMQFGAEGTRRKDWLARSGLPETTFDRAREDLVKAGLVIRSDNKYFVIGTHADAA